MSERASSLHKLKSPVMSNNDDEHGTKLAPSKLSSIFHQINTNFVSLSTSFQRNDMPYKTLHSLNKYRWWFSFSTSRNSMVNFLSQAVRILPWETENIGGGSLALISTFAFSILIFVAEILWSSFAIKSHLS